MIDEMGNSHRWAVFLALGITLVITLWYILAITAIPDPSNNYRLETLLNGHIFFFGVITIIWTLVVVGYKLELEFI